MEGGRLTSFSQLGMGSPVLKTESRALQLMQLLQRRGGEGGWNNSFPMLKASGRPRHERCRGCHWAPITSRVVFG